jgi:RNAse (barnase) inhibitor barstar
MKDWSKLFKSYRGSDVYSIRQGSDLSDIEHLAVSQELAFFKVDLSNVATKEDFLRSTSRALKFPSYFGMNWDAFEECLTDFEWCTAKGYVIVLHAVKAFSLKAPNEFKTARNIFKSAVKYWKAQKKPFYLIIVNK